MGAATRRAANDVRPVADGVYQRQPGIVVVPPPNGPHQDVQLWPEPPPSPDVPVRRRGGHGGGVALVASLGVVILVASVVVAFQLLHPDGGPAAPGPVTQQSAITVPANPLPTTTQASPAPTRVVLKDDGGSVTLTWDDPGAGKVPPSSFRAAATATRCLPSRPFRPAIRHRRSTAST
jgi:hypothetical protein